MNVLTGSQFLAKILAFPKLVTGSASLCFPLLCSYHISLLHAIIFYLLLLLITSVFLLEVYWLFFRQVDKCLVNPRGSCVQTFFFLSSSVNKGSYSAHWFACSQHCKSLCRWNKHCFVSDLNWSHFQVLILYKLLISACILGLFFTVCKKLQGWLVETINSVPKHLLFLFSPQISDGLDLFKKNFPHCYFVK